MKRLSLLTLVLATTLTALSLPAQSQGLTREQVKMDRDSFLALMRWDELTGMWVLKSGMEPPKGVMSRAEVLEMRDQFLRMNVYDDTVGSWVPLKAPRNMSMLTREQVNMETLRFLMMYRYDESRNEWISRMR
ncbi:MULTISPECIES: hypothetical protein [unclassified Roseateles]|uniref:hypothetical protein n=1 Tax=unclassified Roseateles TaxID=2626991 RepID=UPI0006F92F9B|nr:MULTISPECIES: hypothetical protein [unclassified Roseateles]KQW51901.1 hypothetical protein ASC81_04650 [Pelomonas sp. Root405]KRA78134.1 hypothetical protein ASD88_04655 [Pelomonas sp. Root662]